MTTKEKAKKLGCERIIYTEGYQLGGLTKRELAAFIALQGALANGGVETMSAGHSKNPVHMAQIALIAADALLEELTKIE